MNPGVLAIGALAGYIVYDKVVKPSTAVQVPAEKPKIVLPDFSSIFGGGTQPATGNGQNEATGVINSIGGAIESSFQFGSQLLNYFGTQNTSGTSGGSSNSLASYYGDK